MDDDISARGWDPWDGREKTCRADEYGSRTLDGKPIDLSQRAPWVHRLTAAEAAAYTPSAVLGGWDPAEAGAAPAPQAQPPLPSLEVPLWPGNPPGMVPGAGPGADDGTGRFRNVGIPSMYVYLPSGSPKGQHRIALIDCVGGGYTHETRLMGADGAVQTFVPRDVVVIALKYRLTPPSTDVEADARADGLRAVRLVRAHARQWGIAPHKIGLMGASAGANLALNVAIHFDRGTKTASDPVERQSSRPDFVVLLSPWPHGHTVETYPIPKDAPPAFIGTARDDKTASPTFAEGLAANFKKAGVPVDLMIVDTGGHGAYTIGNPGPGGKWVGRFWPWLATIGIRKP
jgi:endo-1,4-beta-xylanase